MSLRGHDVIVTGVGYRMRDAAASPPRDLSEVKLNIGAATACRLAEHGAKLVLAGRRSETVQSVASMIEERWPQSIRMAEACDVTDRGAVRDLLSDMKWERAPALVQCVGLSSGFYSVPNDNPYLLLDEITVERALEETRVPLAALFHSLHELRPVWRRFGGGRCLIVNSMSAIRAYVRGGTHATAKGALHQAVRSAALELYQEGVLLTEVNPGIVDTGLYDHAEVIDAVRDIAASLGQDLSGKDLPMMSPYDVADAIVAALISKAHVVQVNIVAAGQFPHLGA